MPLYQYQCSKCGEITEHFCKIADKPETIECRCGSVAQKILSAAKVLGDDMPAWMRHPEALGCLQNRNDRNKITTRSEYNRYLKTHGIAESSAKREV